MIVISDASPLIAFARLGLLDVLPSLFGQVLIPPAVHRELTSVNPAAIGSETFLSAPWLSIVPLRSQTLATALSAELDPGESEAIALAVQQSNALLLMDERRGRRAAQRLGCRVLGALGILIQAKERGLIDAVAPLLERLSGELSFRISAPLRAAVLEAAGEL